MNFLRSKVLAKRYRYSFKHQNLAIKSSSSNPKKIILDIKGPKEVKEDITLVPEIEILNPEQTICNLDEKTHFHMELMVILEKDMYLPQKTSQKIVHLD